MWANSVIAGTCGSDSYCGCMNLWEVVGYHWLWFMYDAMRDKSDSVLCQPPLLRCKLVKAGNSILLT